MREYSITQALSLPEYKITDVKDDLVRLVICVEPYKRKEFICSRCGEAHAGKINSRKDVTVWVTFFNESTGSSWSFNCLIFNFNCLFDS